MSSHARRFLEMLAAQIPGRASAARTATLRQYATRLAADVPQHLLDKAVADAIAAELPEVPAYADVLRAIRSSPVLPQRPGGAAVSPVSSTAQLWLGFCAGSASDDQLLRRLSVTRAHAGDDAWREVMAEHLTFIRRHRPDWLPRNPEPLTPEQRTEFVRSRLASIGLSLHQAAPPPSGPTVRTRPSLPTAAPARSERSAALIAHYERLAADGNAAAALRAEALRSQQADA